MTSLNKRPATRSPNVPGLTPEHLPEIRPTNVPGLTPEDLLRVRPTSVPSLEDLPEIRPTNAKTVKKTGGASIASLSELAAISKTLNDESNRVNTLLNELERKLRALNLGVEAWAYQEPLSVSPSTFFDPDTEKGYEESRELVLGWTSVGEKGGLAVRTVSYIREEGEWIRKDEGPLTPLLQASRSTRIAALEKTDVLIEALTLRARQVVASIEKAAQAIDKL